MKEHFGRVHHWAILVRARACAQKLFSLSLSLAQTKRETPSRHVSVLRADDDGDAALGYKPISFLALVDTFVGFA